MTTIYLNDIVFQSKLKKFLLHVYLVWVLYHVIRQYPWPSFVELDESDIIFCLRCESLRSSLFSADKKQWRKNEALILKRETKIFYLNKVFCKIKGKNICCYTSVWISISNYRSRLTFQVDCPVFLHIYVIETKLWNLFHNLPHLKFWSRWSFYVSNISQSNSHITGNSFPYNAVLNATSVLLYTVARTVNYLILLPEF